MTNNLQPFTDLELAHEFLCVFVTRGTGLSAHCTVHSHFPPAGQAHRFGHLTRSQLVDRAQTRHKELVDRGQLLQVEVVADWAERCVTSGVKLS